MLMELSYTGQKEDNSSLIDLTERMMSEILRDLPW